VQVSPLCLGTAFRGYRRGRRSEQECVATFERAVELGCNFIDCANVYGFGESEELVGRVVRRLGVRERLVLTSKVGQSMGEGANRGGLSRRYVMAEIDHTLRRLQTDYLDVYFMHQPDPATPLEESLRALHDVVTAGKARYIGVSNHHPTELVELLWIADALGLHRPAVLQYPYSLVQRWLIEREIAPLCRRFGLGLITYSPLAVGLLSGTYRPDTLPEENSLWGGRRRHAFQNVVRDRVADVVAEVIAVAERVGATPGQVSQAWILSHPEVTCIISGADVPAHIEDTAGAVGLELPAEEIRRLDMVSAGLQTVLDGSVFEPDR
jgi:aryl-alcohol dehydrogenase-like predicted oxidoreductase